MKEFNEEILDFNKNIFIFQYDLKNKEYKAKVYSFKKRCNQTNDYILSLPDEVKKQLEKVNL